MTTARASARLRATDRTSSRTWLGDLLVSAAVAVVVLAVALLALLLPPYMHLALDASGAPRALGLSGEVARAMSDRTVSELLFGPATFAFPGPDGRPFYDSAEAGHLRDVRLVLFAFLALAAAAGLALAWAAARHRSRPALWSAVARGGAGLAAVTAALGAVALVAFEFAFELFHRLLFPGGNWAFDPGSQRLVQLYPLAFWQLTAAAIGVLAIAGGAVVWLYARRRARTFDEAP